MKLKLLLLLFLFASQMGMTQNIRFWDGIEDFDGPTDMNPIMASQLDFYFDKLVAPLPDSIYLEIDRLVEKTRFNTKLRDFILWHLLDYYSHPEYLGHDQVFVFLYDQYFSKLEIKGLNNQNRQLIQQKADRLRKLALLNTAPNFQLDDAIDLHSVQSEHIILFFYDHDCDLCHQERKILDSVIMELPNIALLAIDMNSDDARFDTLFNLYDIETTPLIYLLDNEKRIIAKKIRSEQIGLFIPYDKPTVNK